jgi:HEPN domain-containing protein
MKKEKIDLVKKWLEKAKHDLETAERLLKTRAMFCEIICFHAQQAAEKYLKAFLVWNNVAFPKTHSIEDLILLASNSNNKILELKDEAVTLTPFAVETRYGESDDPIYEDANMQFLLRMK